MSVTGYTKDGADDKFVDNTELSTALAGKADASALAAKADASAVAAKANTASPTLTGNPTAPTPGAADNDTTIATTAFVKTAIAGKADTTALAGKVDSTALLAALPATVGTNGQIPKVDATGAIVWAADANTTYTAATQAEVENAASTTARLVTGQRLAQAVAAHAPVKAASGTLTIPQPPATGAYTLTATDGVLTWTENTP